MGTRSATTLKKRQKELARMEKQRDKAAKRLQRKADKAAGIRPADEVDESFDAADSSNSEPAESASGPEN